VSSADKGGGLHTLLLKEKVMDFKLELVLIPASDVDRAKDFYTQTAGFAPGVDGSAG
jgi:hypothetical protein